jgi:hypothetical protein
MTTPAPRRAVSLSCRDSRHAGVLRGNKGSIQDGVELRGFAQAATVYDA